MGCNTAAVCLLPGSWEEQQQQHSKQQQQHSQQITCERMCVVSNAL
jgi:hypothetical protein